MSYLLEKIFKQMIIHSLPAISIWKFVILYKMKYDSEKQMGTLLD